jgi:hypothetical protein
VVGEQLNWDRAEQRRDKRVAAGHRDAEGETVAEAGDAGGIRDHHDVAAARHHFLDIAEGLFEQIVTGVSTNEVDIDQIATAPSEYDADIAATAEIAEEILPVNEIFTDRALADQRDPPPATLAVLAGGVEDRQTDC